MPTYNTQHEYLTHAALASMVSDYSGWLQTRVIKLQGEDYRLSSYEAELRERLVSNLKYVQKKPSVSESDMGALASLKTQLNSWVPARQRAQELWDKYAVEDCASSSQVESLRLVLLNKLEAAHRDWYDNARVGDPTGIFIIVLSASAEEHVQSQSRTTGCGFFTQTRKMLGYTPPSTKFLSKLPERALSMDCRR